MTPQAWEGGGLLSASALRPRPRGPAVKASTLPAGTPEKGDKEPNETEVGPLNVSSASKARERLPLCVTRWVCRELPRAGYEAGLSERGRRRAPSRDKRRQETMHRPEGTHPGHEGGTSWVCSRAGPRAGWQGHQREVRSGVQTRMPALGLCTFLWGGLWTAEQ